MSASKTSKGLFLLILLFLIGAGIYLWKNYGSALFGEKVNQAEEITLSEPEPADTLTVDPTAENVATDSGEVGTVTELPVNDALGVRGIGNPNAPVTVREYFSLTCNHCADFHKGTFQQLKSKYIDTGKVYFIYEEMPLNGPALFGSMIARCLPEERYPEFVALLLDTQRDWAFGGDFRASLQQSASLAGMSEDDFNACFENEELRTAIAENIDASAQAWNISSTPSFVFNDGARILRGGKGIESFDAVYAILTGAPEAPAAATAPTSPTSSITSPVGSVEAFQPNGKVVTPEMMDASQ